MAISASQNVSPDESIPIPLNDTMIRNSACSGEQDLR
jgi:hypothetical protein